MVIKKFILRFIGYIAIAYTLTTFIKGFSFSSAGTLFFFALVLAISHFTIEPVIKFLTFPVNFMTFGLFNFIVSACLLYFFSTIISGFTLAKGSLGPIMNDIVEIPEISLSKIGVIIVSSLFISIFNNLISWTQK